VLAILTVGIGIKLAVAGGDDHHAPGWLVPLSLALAAGGFALAWAMYQRSAINPATMARVLAPFDVMARRRYWLDDLYVGLYRGVLLGFAWLIGWIDRYVVDGLLNVLSAWTLRGGDILRRIQSGQAQDYVYGVAFGLLALIIWSQLWR
jgi:NADH-quinone oxidoreductase subunit L